MATNDLLTAAQLAEKLGVCIDTVRRWTREGKIPRLRVGAKWTRYKLGEVLKSLEMDLARRPAKK